MDWLTKIFMFPASRRIVAHSSLPAFKNFLKTDLVVRGFKKPERLTEHVLDRLTTEAYRIAAEQEDDQLARNGKMYDAVEYVSEQTVRACKGGLEVAPFIRSILVHNGVLDAK